MIKVFCIFNVLYILYVPLIALTLFGKGHSPGGCFAWIPDPDRQTRSSILKQLKDSLLILRLFKSGKGAELASAKSVGPGEGQRGIGQLEGPVRSQMDQW